MHVFCGIYTDITPSSFNFVDYWLTRFYVVLSKARSKNESLCDTARQRPLSLRRHEDLFKRLRRLSQTSPIWPSKRQPSRSRQIFQMAIWVSLQFCFINFFFFYYFGLGFQVVKFSYSAFNHLLIKLQPPSGAL